MHKILIELQRRWHLSPQHCSSQEIWTSIHLAWAPLQRNYGFHLLVSLEIVLFIPFSIAFALYLCWSPHHLLESSSRWKIRGFLGLPGTSISGRGNLPHPVVRRCTVPPENRFWGHVAMRQPCRIVPGTLFPRRWIQHNLNMLLNFI